MAFDKHTLFSIILLLAVFVLGFILSAIIMQPEWNIPTGSFDGAVTAVVNDNYAEVMLEQINLAKTSIYVVMYNMKAYDSNNSVQQLEDALINAKKNGVDVKVILDQSNWGGKITGGTKNNEKAKAYLEAGGIQVKWDSLKETTHVKMLLIDGKVVIIGSTNWTYSALQKNNEANVLIKDSDITTYFLEYFNYLWNKY